MRERERERQPILMRTILQQTMRVGNIAPIEMLREKGLPGITIYTEQKITVTPKASGFYYYYIKKSGSDNRREGMDFL